MKRIILFIAVVTAMLCSATAQNAELDKWVSGRRSTSVTNSSSTQTEQKSEITLPKKTSFLGIGIGYSSGEYVPINIHYTYKKVYYGIGVAIPISKGTKGENYYTMNWDELSEDHVKEGKYCTPVTFDIGYDFRFLTLGIGAGIAVGTKYRNCYDDTHTLGDNGYYYKEVTGQTFGEFKVFAKHRFPSKSGIHFYLSAQYSIRTGIGAVMGFDI